MKVIISGGTGLIGGILTRALTQHGHDVTVLTRGLTKRPQVPAGVTFITYDPAVPGEWQDRIAKSEVVINLAGMSIFRRWSAKAKREIINSRVVATKNLVAAIARDRGRERHLFSASGIGYYGFHGDELLDESSPPGDDFLAEFATRWESAAMEAGKSGARVVLCRFGNVLSTSGGALPKLITLAKWHLGGYWGNGQQWMSWIHQEDLARVFLELLARRDITGPVNFTAPNPVRNQEMMETLSRLLQKKALVPRVPGLMLKLVAGEFANTFLEGQRVLPKKLLDSGFTFNYPALTDVLHQLLSTEA